MANGVLLRLQQPRDVVDDDGEDVAVAAGERAHRPVGADQQSVRTEGVEEFGGAIAAWRVPVTHGKAEWAHTSRTRNRRLSVSEDPG